MFGVSYFIILLYSFFFSVLMTAFSKRLLTKYGFWNALDGERKVPVVRGGGIAVLTAFILCGYLLGSGLDVDAIHNLNVFLGPVILISITGVIDDKYGMKARPKLLLQAVSIALLWLSGYRIVSLFGYVLPMWLSAVLTVFWGISILNAFNLADGMDGLCTGNTIICALSFSILGFLSSSPLLTLFSLLLLGCCCGFLLFNIHPAKIFLGDTGSLFLGLVCTALSLRFNNGNFDFSTVVILLFIFWIPFCDLGLAFWRRKVKSFLKKSGCSVMVRDMYHLHYRLHSLVHGHMLTVAIMWMGMGAFNLAALLAYQFNSLHLTIFLFVLACIISLLLFAQYEFQYSFCLLKKIYRRVFRREF